eukprot:PhF_6_TR1957/c0_g1_i2/m.3172
MESLPTDGLLTRLVRDAVSDRSNEYWLVFQNVHSLEDVPHLLSVCHSRERRMLLPTGEHLRLPPNVRIIFEVSPTDWEALPMSLREHFVEVHCTPNNVGYVGLLEGGLSSGNFLHRFKDIVCDTFVKIFHDQVFTLTDAEVRSCIRSMPFLMNLYRRKDVTGNDFGEDYDRLLDPSCAEPITVFAFIWTFGALVGKAGMSEKAKFTKFLRGAVVDTELHVRFPFPIGDDPGLVYDYVYSVDEKRFLPWSECESLRETLATFKEQSFQNSIPIQYLLTGLVRDRVSLLCVASELTGADTLVASLSQSFLDLQCSAALTPVGLHETMQLYLQRHDDGRISVANGYPKPLIILLRDVVTLRKDTLEVIRDLRNSQGWRDRVTHEFQNTNEIVFVGIVSPSSYGDVDPWMLQDFVVLPCVYEWPQLVAKLQISHEPVLPESDWGKLFSASKGVPQFNGPLNSDQLPAAIRSIMEKPQLHPFIVGFDDETFDTVKACIKQSFERYHIFQYAPHLFTRVEWVTHLRRIIREVMIQRKPFAVVIPLCVTDVFRFVIADVLSLMAAGWCSGDVFSIADFTSTVSSMHMLEEYKHLSFQQTRSRMLQNVRDCLRFVIVGERELIPQCVELEECVIARTQFVMIESDEWSTWVKRVQESGGAIVLPQQGVEIVGKVAIEKGESKRCMLQISDHVYRSLPQTSPTLVGDSILAA